MVDKPDLNDRKRFPEMFGWFDPGQLIDLAREAIVSALFGQYADRRLIQAALDPADANELLGRANQTANIARDQEGAVWIDYVADLGDGFDSTYAIAYLLGKPNLQIENMTLPRGQVLIMGGDQVYPSATRKNYKLRMRQPYALAFPDSNAANADHPALLLIPGNHDWYDGLTLFLALFCTSRKKKIGSWRAIQRRSYFAQKLPDGWWIWAFDSQLGEDIDQPQADYFVTIAREMPENAKIILCAPVPTWLYGDTKAKDAEEREKFYRGINYIAEDIVKVNCKKARIHAVLSGDTHHYSRYSGAKDQTQFIISGGGGAFLHPTHQLADRIPVSWIGDEQDLLLKTEPGDGHNPCDKPACYPSREESLRLLSHNRTFAFRNWRFSLTLGFIYWAAMQLSLLWRDNELLSSSSLNIVSWTAKIGYAVFWSPMFWVLCAGFWFALFKYADAKSDSVKALIGGIHAFLHMVLVLALASFLPPFNAVVFDVPPAGLWSFFLTLAECAVSGFIGATVWGAYLFVVCRYAALHTNDAFSAMRLDSFRHFLRLRLTDDSLTIYPIGLDSVPDREGWEFGQDGGSTQTRPIVVPKTPLRPVFIEKPIVIRSAGAR